jgi:hypothetical protein
MKKERIGKSYDETYSYDDLKYAIANNPIEVKPVWICAEKAGNNDEDSWVWIVECDDGQFAALMGGCDYTGWDYQSSLSVLGVAKTAKAAAEFVPEKEEYHPYLLRKIILDQLSGKIAFGLTDEKIHTYER